MAKARNNTPFVSPNNLLSMRKNMQRLRQHWLLARGICWLICAIVVAIVFYVKGIDFFSEARTQAMLTVLLALGAIIIPTGGMPIVQHYEKEGQATGWVVIGTILIMLLTPFICTGIFIRQTCFAYCAPSYACPNNPNQVQDLALQIRISLDRYISARIEKGEAQQEADLEDFRKAVFDQQDLLAQQALDSTTKDSACRQVLSTALQQQLQRGRDTVTAKVDELLALTQALKSIDFRNEGDLHILMERFNIFEDAELFSPAHKRLCLLREAHQRFSPQNLTEEKINAVVQLRKSGDLIYEIIIR